MSLNRQPAYRDDTSAAETVNSHWAADRVMSLPMSADLTQEQMDRVVAAVSAVCGHALASASSTT
jgi:UDP-2-acetamido-2-deoxy-ribo-hexuluronate aminotransferase